MAMFRCKMCGGTIEFVPGTSVCVCDYCGTKQTLPRLDGDRKANLYDRADHFRRNNDFDKAAAIYEQILAEDKTDAETYWLLVLCRYGVEYVEDPATHKRVPTVNRAQYTSIFDDADYRSALQYADAQQRAVYEAEAAAINEIQKGILAVSQNEEPFDVFICYKETDAQGRRTPDSVLAADLYHQLTNEGFKVFFSRITLEDKLGTAYEPYIFAALNSAKVMVVLGTKQEYFNAVWVKNEWSRYLALVKQSDGKKTLIPAYRDMDPYDLPEEFAHLQAQDMSKLGFMQDLIRGVKKLTAKDDPRPAASKETAAKGSAGGVNVESLLKRAFLFLEDGDWDSADEYAEKVLDQDPENGKAYLAKLMAELRVCRQNDLINCEQPFDDNPNYRKAVRFGGDQLSSVLTGYTAHIKERNKADRLERERQKKQKRVAAKKAAKKRIKIAAIVTPIIVASIAVVVVLTTVIVPNVKYSTAVELYNAGKYDEAITAFKALNGFKDSSEKVSKCLFLKQNAGLTKLTTGLTLKYGFYEQDNNTSNGKEEIEWKVLAVEDNKALVISKYALDCKPYNSTFAATTWEKSTLRTWLNETFYNTAFGADQQKTIVSSIVTPDKNYVKGISPGNNTTDMVFILSTTEVKKYFNSDVSRKCAPTDYAKAQGANTGSRDAAEDDDSCWWWLRSPGSSSDRAALVYFDGSIFYRGHGVDYGYDTVRPAMWIDLS